MKHTLRILGPLSLALFAACATSRPEANIYEFTEGSFEPHAVIENRSLAGRLEIKNAVAERRGGRLYVQFDLHNTGRNPLDFEYIIDWFDSAGFKVEALSNWTPMTLGGNTIDSVTATALVPSANRWRLQVRPRYETQ